MKRGTDYIKPTSTIERLMEYSQAFSDVKNPDFEHNYERVVYQNEAYRTGDHRIYTKYLQQTYPERIDEETKKFAHYSSQINAMNKEEAMHFVEENQIVLFQSDIYILDEDAILSPFIAPPHYVDHFDMYESWSNLINCFVLPDILFQEEREIFLINTAVQ